MSGNKYSCTCDVSCFYCRQLQANIRYFIISNYEISDLGPDYQLIIEMINFGAWLYKCVLTANKWTYNSALLQQSFKDKLNLKIIFYPQNHCGSLILDQCFKNENDCEKCTFRLCWQTPQCFCREKLLSDCMMDWNGSNGSLMFLYGFVEENTPDQTFCLITFKD